MALYIVQETGTEKQWHIGQNISEIYGGFFDSEIISNIAYVQADGHELEYIIEQYTINKNAHPDDRKYTIPIPQGKKIVKWFGDIAKTIVSNL